MVSLDFYNSGGLGKLPLMPIERAHGCHYNESMFDLTGGIFQTLEHPLARENRQSMTS